MSKLVTHYHVVPPGPDDGRNRKRSRVRRLAAVPGRVALLGMLCAGLLGGVAATARAAATEVFVPAGVPATIPNDPLPDARAAAITFSGVNVVQGDLVTITATGTASGGPGFGSFDANGAPAGSQYYSGPASGGDFPNITGPPANIYSLVGTIYSPADLSPAGNQWFLVGTSLTMTANSSGQLALLFDDALYRDSWVPAYADNTGGFDVTITVQSPDTTSPAVTVSFPGPSSGLNGWFNGNDVTPVAGSVTATDPSNVSSISCTGATLGNVSGYGTTTAGGSLTVSGDGIHDVTCTATDGAGNSGEDAGSANTATVKIDTTPPYGVSFAGGGLSDGATYYFGSVPAGPASCSAQDDASGFDHCSLSGYATSVGRHTVTATAYDVAGNSATAALSYTVLPWTLSGFYQPIAMSGAWNVVKAGSTVPLKFNIYAGSAQLTDTADITQPLTVTKVSCTDFSVLSVDTATTTGATSLRYDSTAGQFVYNWQTPSSSGSCYLLTVRTLDGSSLTAGFQLK